MKSGNKVNSSWFLRYAEWLAPPPTYPRSLALKIGIAQNPQQSENETINAEQHLQTTKPSHQIKQRRTQPTKKGGWKITFREEERRPSHEGIEGSNRPRNRNEDRRRKTSTAGRSEKDEIGG